MPIFAGMTGFHRANSGESAPAAGVFGPVIALAAMGAAGCSSTPDEHRSLDPAVVGMTFSMKPTMDDGELELYEVKLSVRLPIRAATAGELQGLAQHPTPPYPRAPWITSDKLGVQVTWTLTNLDAEDHAVELLVDPWNEYGRYWPGFSVTDVQRQELAPNLSGIDLLMPALGTDSEGSRAHGVFTYDDMQELAVDFATVINLIETAPPPDPTQEYDQTATLVNHTFAVQNRSTDDPLTQPYVPKIIPALIGMDIGLRTREPANLALEVAVEIDDHESDRIVAEGAPDPVYRVPDRWYTVGAPGM